MVRRWGDYERTLLQSILTNDPAYCELAVCIADHDQYTEEDLMWSRRQVERWLRTRGFIQMLPFEYRSLLRIQACWRRYLVRKELLFQYDLYRRLAVCDTEDHVKRAVALQRVLKIET